MSAKVTQTAEWKGYALWFYSIGRRLNSNICIWIIAVASTVSLPSLSIAMEKTCIMANGDLLYLEIGINVCIKDEFEWLNC